MNQVSNIVVGTEKESLIERMKKSFREHLKELSNGQSTVDRRNWLCDNALLLYENLERVEKTADNNISFVNVLVTKSGNYDPNSIEEYNLVIETSYDWEAYQFNNLDIDRIQRNVIKNLDLSANDIFATRKPPQNNNCRSVIRIYYTGDRQLGSVSPGKKKIVPY